MLDAGYSILVSDIRYWFLDIECRNRTLDILYQASSIQHQAHNAP
jgi:hypothetical protein